MIIYNHKKGDIVDNTKIVSKRQQKEQLMDDVQAFKADYLDAIAHTSLENDRFANLGVFGNYYQLAIDASPELKAAWVDYLRRLQEQLDTIANLSEAELDKKATARVLKKHNIDISSRTTSRDTYGLTVQVNGESIFWDGFRDYGEARTKNGVIEELENILKIADQADSKVVKQYLSLKKSLSKDKGFLAGSRNERVKNKIEKLIKDNSDLQNYIRIAPHIDVLKTAIAELSDLELLNDQRDFELSKINKSFNAERLDIKKAMNSKSATVLALAYLRVYNRNYEYLKMAPNGAKERLFMLLTDGVEYYAKSAANGIHRNLDKWIAVGEIASKLHESWRETRKNEDGSYEPRWKKVSDRVFESRVKAMEELPETIRIVNGAVEQDIANTTFEDLCLNYQIENFEAAQLAFKLAKENYTDYEIGTVGDIIHKEWLKRNAWAKGGELDIPFEELPENEQEKDILQYRIACEVCKSMTETHQKTE